VALLNDLDWYLVRFVDDALVLEPSVSEEEWLSRDLASVIRDDEIDPGATGRFLKVYGVEYPDPGPATDQDGTVSERPHRAGNDSPPRLVEPMLLARTGETLPEYDLRDVGETLVVRVTEAEFEG